MNAYGPESMPISPYAGGARVRRQPAQVRVLNATVRAIRLTEQQLAAQYRWTPYRAYLKAMRG